MSNNRIYQHYLYLAGVKVPFISDTISSQYGSLASLDVEIQYSPFILHIHEDTKVEIWEQIIDNGQKLKETLEFDGVVVGITKNKNILGEVTARLTCLTDGKVWNQRKQYDFYINNILDVTTAGTDIVANMRADGSITNFFNEVLQNNRFDIGCAVASILTSRSEGISSEFTGQTQQVVQSKYSYTYNGKKFLKNLQRDTIGKDVTPYYYDKFLNNYKLGNKVYGISTSENVKQFFQQDNFIKLITNGVNDLLGENSFWTIASTVLQYGFYNLYDIPNPTYINNLDPSKDIKDLDELPSTGSKVKYTTVLGKPDGDINRISSGLGEYLLKPISVLGIPYKCNIIWPDQVLRESLFYDFVNSPTRVLFQQQGLPGVTDSIVLTTTMSAGPHFVDNNTNYFSSYNTPPILNNGINIRPQTVYSDYEKEYGLRSQRLNLSYAFDASLLRDNDGDVKDTESKIALNKKINNFLNYEFAQRFLSARSYSIDVTPDVSVVAGMSTVVLNRDGQHIVCFCTGIQKSWNANGRKSVNISVAYPRYYYENIGELGNIIDPLSQDPVAIKEMNMIIGSEPLDGLKSGSNSNNLISSVEDLFENFNSNPNVDQLKLSYRRSVCSYENFMSLHNIQFSTIFESEYQNNLFQSTPGADKLSTHVFKVFNSKQIDVYENWSNRDIIKEHIKWCSSDRRI